MASYRIGEVVHHTGISADTLRYYERIGLLPPVNRTRGGTRLYGKRDLSRLRFIRRAQAMGFALSDISTLLRLRENPGTARSQAHALTQQKLGDVNARLEELTVLRNELELLLDACNCAEGEMCPIIEGLERDGQTRSPRMKRTPDRRSKRNSNGQ